MSGAAKVCIEPTVDKAIDLAAELVKIIVCESLEQHDSCNVALAGGTTPHQLYQRLAKTVAELLGEERLGACERPCVRLARGA